MTSINEDCLPLLEKVRIWNQEAAEELEEFRRRIEEGKK